MPYGRDIRRRRRSGDWGWIPEFSGKSLISVGSTTLALLLRGEDWVHRRVETLTFVDAGVVRRYSSIDFTLPRRLPTPFNVDGKPLYFVPIAVLHRESNEEPRSMLYDVRCEQGEVLPLLTKRENSRITAATLSEFARRVLQPAHLTDQLASELGRTLAYVPFLIYPVALSLTRSILVPNSPEWHELKAPVAARMRLCGHKGFRSFLSLVTGNSICVVPLLGPPGQRRVVKLVYEEKIERPEEEVSKSRRWLEEHIAVPFRPETASIRSPLIGSAASHHVQVVIPPNLEMTDVTLESRDPYDAIRPSLERGGELAEPAYESAQGGFLRRSHLYIPHAHRLTSGSVRVDLRAERRGLLTGATVASFMIVLVLLFYWRAIGSLLNQSSTSVGLLLLAPGLITAYLARPGEHALARKTLLVPRLLLTISTALVFGAAAAILAWGSDGSTQKLAIAGVKLTVTSDAARPASDLRPTLFILFLISCVICAMVVASRILPRPRNG